MYSPYAVELLMGTCAQESAMGKYRKQIGGGPALGIMQIEPNTFHDVINNFLSYREEVAEKVKKACGVTSFNATDLVYNDKLSICFARLIYYRVKESIPATLEKQAAYYKKYYNTPLGKATEDEYIRNYNKYCV